MDAFAIGFYRLALAAPALMVLNWKHGGREVEKGRGGGTLNLVIVGVFMAVSHVSYYQAISYMGVSVAALVTCSTMPIMVAFISWISGFETMTRRLALALVLAVSGVVFLLGGPEYGHGLRTSYLGGGLALGASLFLALATLTGKRALVGHAPMFSATLTTSAAALVLLPLAGYKGLSWSFGIQGWCLLIYMGIFPTALAYTLYFSGLKVVRATVASVLTLAEPLTAVLLARLLLGERLAWTGWVGAVMLVGAFLLMFNYD